MHHSYRRISRRSFVGISMGGFAALGVTRALEAAIADRAQQARAKSVLEIF